MNLRTFGYLLMAATFLLLASSTSFAQRQYDPSVGVPPLGLQNYLNRSTTGTSTQSRNNSLGNIVQEHRKPFSNYSPEPTVSPYLNLLRSDGGALPNYQTLVEPIIRQREFNRVQQREIQSLSQRFQNAQAAQQAVPVGAQPGVRTTGHQSYFMNFSHFYNRR